MNKLMRTLLILSLTGVALIFQNCSAPKHEDASSMAVTQEADFFEYPYAAKTDFYVDMRLYKSGNTPGLSEFVFAGSVTYPADLSAVRTYSVRIRSLDNAVLCPVQTGTLPAGVTAITFNCVSAVQSNSAKLEITVTAAGKTQVFSRLY